ncbi:hypothetical protein AB3Y40_08415 [Yoonia sp. R2331]
MEHRFRRLRDTDIPPPRLTLTALTLLATVLSVPVWLVLTLLT